MVCTAPRRKRHRGREIVLDAKKHQSGDIDYTGRISKIGDGSLRTDSTMPPKSY
jgi:transposase